MPWAVAAAVIGVAGTVYASNKSSEASKNAANAQTDANNASIAEQQREYNQTRQDQLPFLQAGYGALNKENAFLNGDWSGFMNSPDYKFSLDQGIGALDKSAAAHGALYAGGHSADLLNFAEGTADKFANNYWNKLAGQAGQGQVSATNLGSLGAGEANQISALLNASGNARASSYLEQGNIAGQEGAYLGNAFDKWLGYYGNRNSGTSGNYSFGQSPDYGGGFSTSSFNGGDFSGGAGSGQMTGSYDVFGLGGG